MKPLYDLQQELNRLFIAGSKFAKNDPRLQKYVPILKKLGEKAPIFNKLAQEVEALLQVENAQAAEKLLNVSTLLYSVLYTQGVTLEAEATKESQVPTIQLADVNTTYSYLQLKPVLQALTQSNSGRLEILQDAFERKIFDDSRTYGYLSYALADKYSELAYYVENTIIPACGKAMIPFLIADFRLEDKNENVRRLRLLYQLGYAEIGTLVDKIFSENLPNLQTEAIDIIADKKDEQTEAFIISLTGDKNKAVRGAAYSALAKLATQRSIDKLYELYNTNKQKGNAELLASAISIVAAPEYYLPFVDKIQERYQQLLTIDTSDGKNLATAFERFVIDIDIIFFQITDDIIMLFNKPFVYSLILKVFYSISVHSLRQVAHKLNKAFVSCSRKNVIMKFHILFCHLRNIPRLGRLYKSPCRLLYIEDVFLASSCAGKFNRKLLKGAPYLKYILQIFFCNITYGSTSSWYYFCQTFCLKHMYGFPDRSSAYSQFLGKFYFHQPFTWF